MRYKIIVIFTFLFFYCLSISYAQIDLGNEEKNMSESDLLDIDYNDLEDEFSVDNDNKSMLFIYFDWMPGYGLYQNFDVMQVHYRHSGSFASDTILLGRYVHPAEYKITSNYGPRRRNRMHYGVDIGFPVGTPVVASFDGIIRFSNYNNGGYGNLIIIRHLNGLETYYAHLSKRFVNPGQVVHAGDTIGLGGNTGRSFGSHLHFETRYLGKAFNPNKIIDFTSNKTVSDTIFIKGYVSTENIAVKNNSTEEQKTVATSQYATTYYKVKNGDTLSDIAKKYGTSVTKIQKLNGLKNDFIRLGQRLQVR